MTFVRKRKNLSDFGPKGFSKNISGLMMGQFISQEKSLHATSLPFQS
jgi:hypothetical protein